MLSHKQKLARWSLITKLTPAQTNTSLDFDVMGVEVWGDRAQQPS